MSSVAMTRWLQRPSLSYITVVQEVPREAMLPGLRGVTILHRIVQVAPLAVAVPEVAATMASGDH